MNTKQMNWVDSILSQVECNPKPLNKNEQAAIAWALQTYAETELRTMAIGAAAAANEIYDQRIATRQKCRKEAALNQPFDMCRLFGEKLRDRYSGRKRGVNWGAVGTLVFNSFEDSWRNAFMV